jgi:hypothetical protein
MAKLLPLGARFSIEAHKKILAKTAANYVSKSEYARQQLVLKDINMPEEINLPKTKARQVQAFGNMVTGQFCNRKNISKRLLKIVTIIKSVLYLWCNIVNQNTRHNKKRNFKSY